MGQTFTKIIADQFQRLRDGSRFFYLNRFQGSQLLAIQNTTLADIIARNSGTTNLQSNVFFFKTSVSGRVTTGDPRRLMGVSGVKFELHDSTGAVVATTTTDASGGYRFSQVGLGTYSVTVAHQKTNGSSKTVTFTKGAEISNVNFVAQLSTPITNDPMHHFGGHRLRV